MQATFDVLCQSTRSFVLETLPRDRSPEAEAEIETIGLSHLLIRYFNWSTRLIPQMPRKVHLSKLMEKYLTDGEQAENVRRLAASIEAGEPLRPHLSRRINKGVISGADAIQKPFNVRKRPDLDLLLNDWSLHHLHLGFKPEGDGFYERGDALVIGYFCADHAFLIDVIKHGEWTADSIYQAILETWDDWFLFPTLQGIAGPEKPLAEKDRHHLRTKGVATFIEHAGEIRAPIFSLTSAGSSLRSTELASLVMRGIAWTAARWRRYDPERLSARFWLEPYRCVLASDLLGVGVPIDMSHFFPVPTRDLS